MSQSLTGRRQRKSDKPCLQARLGIYAHATTPNMGLSTTKRGSQSRGTTSPSLPTAQTGYFAQRAGMPPSTSWTHPSARGSGTSGGPRAGDGWKGRAGQARVDAQRHTANENALKGERNQMPQNSEMVSRTPE